MSRQHSVFTFWQVLVAIWGWRADWSAGVGWGPGAPRRLASAAMAWSSRASRRACWSAARRARNSAMARRCSAWAASWRTRAARAGFFRVAGPPGVTRRLVAGELGDGFLGAGIVDEVLAGRGGGDERGGCG